MQQMNFCCRSYCLLNMFRAPLCPSSGALEYYTSGCCLSYLVLGFQVVGMVWSWGLCDRFAGCWCPKHVEQAIRSAIKKIHLLHLVGILFPQCKPCFHDKVSSFSLPDFSDDSFQHMLSESITSRFLLTGTETLLVLMMHLHIQVQVVQPWR
jgi:hypothetical protein